MKRLLALFITSLVIGGSLIADSAVTFSKSQNLNFYREVPSRDLKGLAIRSDGRIITGPQLSALAGNPVADLWWDIEAVSDQRWLVGTGPSGKILEIEVDASGGTFSAAPWAETGGNHVFTLKHLSNGMVVAGTAPDATLLILNKSGEEQASVALPADSILDILIDDAQKNIWVSTGNPGSIYHINLRQLLKSGPEDSLDDRGVELWGKVRDRNIRQLAWNSNGRILAGSAPSGNLYEFPKAGGDPLILLDQESGEITDIFLSENGDIYTTLVSAKGTASRRISGSTNVTPTTETTEKKADGEPTAPSPAPSIMEAPPVVKFSGRSQLFKIPADRGLPESLSSRSNLAMYQIVPYRDLLILPGGDDGELSGYDPAERRAISFAGSNSAQISEIVAMDSGSDFLAITNNPAGLSLLRFSDANAREATTRRINLLSPSEIGALRFNRIRNLDRADLTVHMRANRGRDLVEGWTPWTEALQRHDGWLAPGLTGQFLQIKIELPSSLEASVELDQAEVYFVPQNRRPVLNSFRLISPNFGLVARTSSTGNTPNMTLGQVIGTSPSANKSESERRRQSLLASQVVPQPGAQVVMWTTSDADNDNLVSTFSIRAEGKTEWTDLAIETDAEWFQFDRTTLEEGTYFTRLVLSERAPRALAQRRSVTFQTDDLVIDLTPPDITKFELTRESSFLGITIAGTDQVSLIAGAKLVFNSGLEIELGQPADGILDSPSETFTTQVRLDTLGPATSVEVYLEDEAGNVVSERHPLH